MSRLKLIAVVLLMGIGTFAVAAGWDGSFRVKSTVAISDGVAQSCVYSQFAYVKVTCDVDAYVGNRTDGGSGIGGACTSTTCDWVKFSLGEKYYSQMTGAEYFVSMKPKTGNNLNCTCLLGSN